MPKFLINEKMMICKQGHAYLVPNMVKGYGTNNSPDLPMRTKTCMHIREGTHTQRERL